MRKYHPHDDNQGRIGMYSTNASRVAIGMHPITEDEPITIPWPLKVLCIFSAVFCMALATGVLDPWFPKF